MLNIYQFSIAFFTLINYRKILKELFLYCIIWIVRFELTSVDWKSISLPLTYTHISFYLSKDLNFYNYCHEQYTLPIKLNRLIIIYILKNIIIFYLVSVTITSTLL
jgi:hypothetical protein